MTGGNRSFEVSVRCAFARLTRDDLPRAAAERGWPVRTSEDFERLLLDHLRDEDDSDGGFGRAETPTLVDLILAVELGEGLLAGNLCCRTMNGRLRKAACEAGDGDPIEALLAAFTRKRNRLQM
jgi:hypothetical protein